MSKNKPKEIIPSEDFETKRLANWLDQAQAENRILRFSHIANENMALAQRLKNYSLGTRAGIPDFVVLLKPIIEGTARYAWIELKRSKKSLSRVSVAQQNWLSDLGIDARVCYGADEAIAWLEEIL